MYLIGDAHGQWKDYVSQLQTLLGSTSILLGDVGHGFRAATLPVVLGAFNIRGNHDKPEVARQHPHYLGDVGYRAPVFFIGGGLSIDAYRRVPGISWWPDEELTEAQRFAALVLYEEIKPRFVVSHDAPVSAAAYLLTRTISQAYGYDREYYQEKLAASIRSKVSLLMEDMLKIHQPERWVFAHFHTSSDFTLPEYQTQFTVLDELECREFPEIEFETENVTTVMPDGQLAVSGNFMEKSA